LGDLFKKSLWLPLFKSDQDDYFKNILHVNTVRIDWRSRIFSLSL